MVEQVDMIVLVHPGDLVSLEDLEDLEGLLVLVDPRR
jgi:hypothetical protein